MITTNVYKTTLQQNLAATNISINSPWNNATNEIHTGKDSALVSNYITVTTVLRETVTHTINGNISVLSTISENAPITVTKYIKETVYATVTGISMIPVELEAGPPESIYVGSTKTVTITEHSCPVTAVITQAKSTAPIPSTKTAVEKSPARETVDSAGETSTPDSESDLPTSPTLVSPVGSSRAVTSSHSVSIFEGEATTLKSFWRLILIIFTLVIHI